MTDLPLIPADSHDDTPLPLIVAKRWGFPLAHVETDAGLYYAVQDWMRGIIGGDIRFALSKMRRYQFEINSAIKLYPYLTTNKKFCHRPYIDERGLIKILLYSRLVSGRSSLVAVRNFIAEVAPHYEYLKCSPVSERRLTEHAFQASLVNCLKVRDSECTIQEYFSLKSGHIIDILVMRKKEAVQRSFFHKREAMALLIECKTNTDEFYKAVGQITCYKVELSWEAFETSVTRLAIAMPYEDINDYMRHIAKNVGFDLLSVVDGFLINALNGENYVI